MRTTTDCMLFLILVRSRLREGAAPASDGRVKRDERAWGGLSLITEYFGKGLRASIIAFRHMGDDVSWSSWCIVQ